MCLHSMMHANQRQFVQCSNQKHEFNEKAEFPVKDLFRCLILSINLKA